ncbi:MAG TPA: FkbM family methyltransferase [Dyella sp.]|uniref:FkbM family methyltransferase n=1 Tax=Dyella sp. TaxID=1869338 RepID=UPI002F923DDA
MQEQAYQRSLQSHTWAYEQQLKLTVSIIQEVQSLRLCYISQRSDMPGQKFDQLIERFMPWDDLAARLDRLESHALVSKHRFAVPCGDGATLVATNVGYVLCAADDAPMIASLIELGDIERGTRLFIQSAVKQGDAFIDIGAHVGMHSLAAARAMGGLGHVYAFEAYGPTAKLLERSVWTNGYASMVSVHHQAIGRESASRTLYLGKISGHHSLFPLDASHVGDKEPVRVDTVRLDEVVPHSAPVALMKIDVEGAELDVLAGARSLIEAHPNMGIIVEYGPSHLSRSGHSRDEWFGAFASLNMEYRVIDPETGVLLLVSCNELDRFESTNLLFARRDSSRWFSKP